MSPIFIRLINTYFPWIVDDSNLLASIPELEHAPDDFMKRIITLNDYRAPGFYWWLLKKIVQMNAVTINDTQRSLYTDQIQSAVQYCTNYASRFGDEKMVSLWMATCRKDEPAADARIMPTTLSLVLHLRETPYAKPQIVELIKTTESLNVQWEKRPAFDFMLNLLTYTLINSCMIQRLQHVVEHLDPIEWNRPVQLIEDDAVTPLFILIHKLIYNLKDRSLMSVIDRVESKIDPSFWGTSQKSGATPLRLLFINPTEPLHIKTAALVAEKVDPSFWGIELTEGEEKGDTPLRSLIAALAQNPTSDLLLRAVYQVALKVDLSVWATEIKQGKYQGVTPIGILFSAAIQCPSNTQLLKIVSLVDGRVDDTQKVKPIIRKVFQDESFGVLIDALMKSPANKPLLQIASIISTYAEPADWKLFFSTTKDTCNTLMFMCFSDIDSSPRHPFQSCLSLLVSKDPEFRKLFRLTNLGYLWSETLKRLKDVASLEHCIDFLLFMLQQTPSNQWFRATDAIVQSKEFKAGLGCSQPLITVLLNTLEPIRDSQRKIELITELTDTLTQAIVYEQSQSTWPQMSTGQPSSALGLLFHFILTYHTHPRVFDLLQMFDTAFYDSDFAQKKIRRLIRDASEVQSSVTEVVSSKLKPLPSNETDKKMVIQGSVPRKAAKEIYRLWDLVASCTAPNHTARKLYHSLKEHNLPKKEWAEVQVCQHEGVENTWTPWLLLVDSFYQKSLHSGFDASLYELISWLLEHNKIPDAAWQQSLMLNGQPIDTPLRLLMISLEKSNMKNQFFPMIEHLLHVVPKKSWLQEIPNHLNPFHILINLLLSCDGWQNQVKRGTKAIIIDLSKTMAPRMDPSKMIELQTMLANGTSIKGFSFFVPVAKNATSCRVDESHMAACAS